MFILKMLLVGGNVLLYRKQPEGGNSAIHFGTLGSWNLLVYQIFLVVVHKSKLAQCIYNLYLRLILTFLDKKQPSMHKRRSLSLSIFIRTYLFYITRLYKLSPKYLTVFYVKIWILFRAVVLNLFRTTTQIFP